SVFSIADGDDKTLRRIELASGQDKVLETYSVGLRSLARRDRTLAVAVWGDYLVRLWDIVTEKEKTTIKIAGEVGEAVAFDAKGQMLAEGGWGNHLALYESTGKLKYTLEGHKRDVYGVAFSPDDKLLVSVGGWWSRQDIPGEIKVWDTATGEELAPLGTK